MQRKLYNIVIQNKTRQRADSKKKNILKQKANKTKTKSKNQKLTWETGRKGERNETKKRETKKEKINKGEAKKGERETKGDTER